MKKRVIAAISLLAAVLTTTPAMNWEASKALGLLDQVPKMSDVMWNRAIR